jgi:hypothetical protein
MKGVVLREAFTDCLHIQDRIREQLQNWVSRRGSKTASNESSVSRVKLSKHLIESPSCESIGNMLQGRFASEAMLRLHLLQRKIIRNSIFYIEIEILRIPCGSVCKRPVIFACLGDGFIDTKNPMTIFLSPERQVQDAICLPATINLLGMRIHTASFGNDSKSNCFRLDEHFVLNSFFRAAVAIRVTLFRAKRVEKTSFALESRLHVNPAHKIKQEWRDTSILI